MTTTPNALLEKTSDINSIIEKEAEYFAEILERISLYDENQKNVWKKETIFERKQRLSNEIYERYKGQVIRGAFKGLKLQKKTPRQLPDFGSLLLGFYELHVTTYITSLFPQGCDLFIDIGASEGYFPIGMLLNGFAKKAIAYEGNTLCQNAMRENARINNVESNLLIEGYATEDAAKKIAKVNGNKIILCDIAGAEFNLFTPNFLELLSDCHIIIEIHHWFHQDFFKRYTSLLESAAKIFDISFLKEVDRPLSEVDDLMSFNDDNRYLLCSEHRPSLMRYLVLVPKS